MDDFFKKLNVLVRAGINDLLSEDRAHPRGSLRPERLGKDVDREIAALRERINQALDYEDELQTRVTALQTEAANLDQIIDDLVARSEDAAARHSAEQLQRTRQRLTVAESDLRAHQMVTQELIQRVNELDAAVADARQREHQKGGTADSSPGMETTSQAEAEGQSASKRVSDVLHEMRMKISEMSDIIAARDDVAQSGTPSATAPEAPDEKAVEEDLARRRDRLSKK